MRVGMKFLTILIFTTMMFSLRSEAGMFADTVSSAVVFGSLNDYIKGSTTIERVNKKEFVTNSRVMNDSGRKFFTLFSLFKTDATFEQAKVLSDFGKFKEIGDYVKRADYDKEKGIFNLDSGIWKYFFKAEAVILDDTPEKTSWTVVGGSYDGMTGEMRFWPKSPKETYCMIIANSVKDKYIVPDMVMEKGTEIVLKYGSNFLRDQLEKKTK